MLLGIVSVMNGREKGFYFDMLNGRWTGPEVQLIYSSRDDCELLSSMEASNQWSAEIRACVDPVKWFICMIFMTALSPCIWRVAIGKGPVFISWAMSRSQWNFICAWNTCIFNDNRCLKLAAIMLCGCVSTNNMHLAGLLISMSLLNSTSPGTMVDFVWSWHFHSITYRWNCPL